MKELVLRALFACGILAHRVDLCLPTIPLLDVRGCVLSLIVSSSNNLVEIEGKTRCFFRFVSSQPNKRSIIKSVFSSYERLTGNNLSTLEKALESPSKARAFLRMGDFRPGSGIYRFFLTGNPSYVGLDRKDIGGIDDKTIKGFFYYAWSEVCTYYKNKRGGKYQLYSYNRSRCQQSIYELFNVPELICGIDLIRIKGFHDTFLGSIMYQATGLNPLSFRKGEIKNRISPVLMKDLNILHVLDVLCNERDHRPGNYNVILDEDGSITSIQAFDNDSDLSFFPVFNVSRPLRGCPGLVKSDGCLSINHLDKQFADKFLSVSTEELKRVVSPYLNLIQITALLYRFRKIKISLKKTIVGNNSFLKGASEWTESDLLFEIEPRGEKNYTSLLAEWYEGEKDPIIQAQNQWEKIRISF